MSMTTSEIRLEAAIKNDCSSIEVKCYKCKYWGFNNGKVLTSSCASKCLKRKEKTYCDDFCKNFEKKCIDK